MRAVYRDNRGAAYSCPVETHDGKWGMVTSEGHQPITHYFDDDVAGRLTFVQYRGEPDLRLHISRMPGESSLGALQRAYAEKEIVAKRRHRQAARQKIQDVP